MAVNIQTDGQRETRHTERDKERETGREGERRTRTKVRTVLAVAVRAMMGTSAKSFRRIPSFR